MRLFVSINFDKKTKAKLFNVVDKFKDKLSESTISKLRWETTDKIHLTLFFLGETPGEKVSGVKLAISNAVKNYYTGKIILGTDSIGAFPDLCNSRVIFFKLKGEIEKLRQLQKLISENLSTIEFRQDKKFNPHLTFVRVKIPKYSKYQLSNDLQKLTSDLKFDINFEVNKISLMKSTLQVGGAVHEEIEGLKLKKATISDRL